jgi:hypothetical protein
VVSSAQDSVLPRQLVLISLAQELVPQLELALIFWEELLEPSPVALPMLLAALLQDSPTVFLDHQFQPTLQHMLQLQLTDGDTSESKTPSKE